MHNKMAITKLITWVIFIVSTVSTRGSVVFNRDLLNVSENLESVEGQRVKMTAGDVEVVIVLNDSKAAADFVRMLPLELSLIERNHFAKGMTLPRSLDTDEETTIDYEIGDFGYWAGGPDLAIFYDDIYEHTVVPIIPMGKAESNAENMRNTSGTVRLELVSEPNEEMTDSSKYDIINSIIKK